MRRPKICLETLSSVIVRRSEDVVSNLGQLLTRNETWKRNTSFVSYPRFVAWPLSQNGKFCVVKYNKHTNSLELFSVRNDERNRRESACVVVTGARQPGVQSKCVGTTLLGIVQKDSWLQSAWKCSCADKARSQKQRFGRWLFV